MSDTHLERSNTFIDAHYFAGNRDTFLYFDKPRGKHDFVAIVHGTLRKELPEQPEYLVGRKVCVSGEVSGYKKRAAMRIGQADQIGMMEPTGNASK